MWVGLIAGAAVALTVCMPGWAALRWAVRRRPQAVVMVALGSIPLRLAAAGGLTYGLLALLPISRAGYVAGLALTYFGALILEAASLCRRPRGPAC